MNTWYLWYERYRFTPHQDANDTPDLLFALHPDGLKPLWDVVISRRPIFVKKCPAHMRQTQQFLQVPFNPPCTDTVHYQNVYKYGSQRTYKVPIQFQRGGGDASHCEDFVTPCGSDQMTNPVKPTESPCGYFEVGKHGVSKQEARLGWVMPEFNPARNATRHVSTKNLELPGWDYIKKSAKLWQFGVF